MNRLGGLYVNGVRSSRPGPAKRGWATPVYVVSRQVLHLRHYNTKMKYTSKMIVYKSLKLDKRGKV